MKVELINNKIAKKRSSELHELAWDIANSYKTVPSNCQERQCLEFIDYLAVTTLKDNEVCVFVEGLAARQLTDFKITDTTYALGKICAKELDSVSIQNNELVIKYTDGVIEYYKYHDKAEAWYFDRNNANTDFKLPQPSMS